MACSLHRPPTMVAEVTAGRDACGDLEEVVDALGAAILALAPDGTIVFANARAESLFRTHRHALEGVPLVASNVSRWVAPLAQLLDGQARDSRPTLSLLTERGPALLLGYTLTQSAREGATLHVLSFQDLTGVRALEEERDRLLRLATVGEVMPMLLHETKNPLAAACTLIELLIEEREEPTLQGDLHAILVEIRRALLSLEGLGSAGRDLRTSTTHAVDHAIQEVVALVEARARRHDVRLRAQIAPLPLLPLDPSSLRAIVLNLITNAIHACESGGDVTVRMRLEAHTLILEVEDDGVGMSPEVQRRACETFFTTKRSGSGLGLALCARLVNDARGTLSIDSAQGVGTRVHIEIPHVDARAPQRDDTGGQSHAE